ncbi:MAG: hypothetical protein IEMM0002_0404 [bacterium]|nr:MAG: hypothetical protein IEMM0002_0404 [bacterium]
MARISSIDTLFCFMLSFAAIGVFQFAVANLFGIMPSIALGAFCLAIWITAAGWVLIKNRPWETVSKTWLLLFALIALFTFWIGSMPPYFRDDLIVHLAIPKQILGAGEWSIPGFQSAAARPNFLLPVNMIFVAAGQDWAVSYIPLIFFLSTGFLLYQWIRSEFGHPWAFCGSMTLLTLPLFFRLSTTAYNDAVVMFFASAGMYYLYAYLREGVYDNAVLLSPCGKRKKSAVGGLISESRYKNAVWGAVALAAGCAVKYNAGLLLSIALIAVFALDGITYKKIRNHARIAAVSVIAVLLFCGPWWVRESLIAYPPTHKKATSGIDVEVDVELGMPIRQRMVFCGESWPKALSAPVRLFFTGREGGGCSFDGRLNPFILIFGIAALFFRYKPPFRFLIYSVVFYMASASLLINVVARYFLPVLPALIFLAVSFLSSLAASPRAGGKPVALFFAAAMLLYNLMGGAKAAAGFDGWDYLKGRESAKAFLSRKLPHHGAIEYANRNLSEKDLIYFAFLGNRVYYSDVPYVYDPFWSGATLMKIFTSGKTGEEIMKAFERRGITHLLYHRGIMRRFLRQNRLDENFTKNLEEFTKTLYEDQNSALLEFK